MKNRFTDLASERALVGSLIVNPYCFIEIADIVQLQMFTSPICRDVMAELFFLHDEGKEPDIILISDNLTSKNLPYSFDDVSELIAYVNSDSLRDYANNIKHAYLSRELTRQLNDGLSMISGGEDVLKVINSFDTKKDSILDQMQDNRNDHVSNLVKHSLDLVHFAREKKGLVGLDTGSAKLNNHFGGWQQGRLIVLAGRPAMGKTTIALNWCLAAAQQGEGVVIFSLEVSNEMTVLTLVSILTGIQTDLMIKGKVTDEQLDKIQTAHAQLSELPIFIIDNVYGIEEIVSKSRFYAKKFGVKLMMLDYIQLVRGNRGAGDSRHLEVESVMQGLKKITKKTDAGLCVITLSQLNRGVETRGGTKRPMMSDLKESGSIEEGADIGVLIYRPEYYGIVEDEEGVSTKGVTELIIGKNKWGAVGTIKQKMVHRRFVDLEDIDFQEIEMRPEPSKEEINAVFGDSEEIKNARPDFEQTEIPF